MNAPQPVLARAKRRPSWKAWWLKQLHMWHWMSAALSLAATLAFAVTGLTLNHAASISATPVVTERAGTLPAPLLPQLAHPATTDAPLPPAVAAAVQAAVGLDAGSHAGEWSDDEVYVALPRPGGDAWVSIARTDGAIKAEVTDRGWVSWFNDLHKGRNAGAVWFWFIDVFAGACVVFTLTGLLLLQLHAKRRPSTWWLVAVGLVVPAVLAHWFIR